MDTYVGKVAGSSWSARACRINVEFDERRTMSKGLEAESMESKISANAAADTTGCSTSASSSCGIESELLIIEARKGRAGEGRTKARQRYTI